jgi:hypothetical protein
MPPECTISLLIRLNSPVLLMLVALKTSEFETWISKRGNLDGKNPNGQGVT